MPGKILKCKCHHEFQDSRYGKGWRVFTRQDGNGGKQIRDGVYACTVCGREVSHVSESAGSLDVALARVSRERAIRGKRK